MALVLLLIPLVEGQKDGWPAWILACFGACVVVFALLAVWSPGQNDAAGIRCSSRSC